jgi:hypothetical protein
MNFFESLGPLPQSVGNFAQLAKVIRTIGTSSAATSAIEVTVGTAD